MNILRNKTFAIIGMGNIGGILIARLLSAGVSTNDLVICDTDQLRVESIASKHNVRTVMLPDESICKANVLLVAAPPKSTIDILKRLTQWLCPKELVVSFAAAVPLDSLEAELPADTPVVRIMPNAPSLVGQGMNPVAYGHHVTPEARALAQAILKILGETVIVQDSQMNWCAGLSGAAMRSVLPALLGMTLAGVEAGLSEKDARRVAAQVMLGTATLALQTDMTFEEIKALTPMQIIDEPVVTKLFQEAVHTAKGKIDQLQDKLASV